jgi:kynurenine formamidase
VIFFFVKPIDLTLTISENLLAFPGSPKPHFISWSKIKPDGYNLELLFLSTHTGTHLDAPFHFIEKGKKIHEILPIRLISDAILLHIQKEANQLITKADIIEFEKRSSKIKNNSTVIFATGWQKNFQKEYYFKKNPGLSTSAARYLVSKKVNLVGIDSPSIDKGNDTKFSVHQIFSKNNVLILENLCNLEKIPAEHFKLIVLPLKLKDATGSPVRAVAV